MSNQRSSPSGKGWHPPQGTITMFPSVGRFENEPAATTLYTKGSSAKFSDDDGRKSFAPYSNHGQLPQQQLSQQQPSSGIVGLRTAPSTGSKDANWGAMTNRQQLCPLLASYFYHIRICLSEYLVNCWSMSTREVRKTECSQ